MSKMKICKNCNNAMPANMKICPACGAKNKKPFYKRWWFIFIVIIVLLGIIGSIGDNKKSDDADKQIDKTTTYTWPDSALGNMILQPSSKYGKVSFDSEDSFLINVYQVLPEEFEEYIKECKDSGFTVNYSKIDNKYYADNEDGYSLALTYDTEEETMTISLDAPNDESETNSKTSEEDSTITKDSTEENQDVDQSGETEESSEQSTEPEENAETADNSEELVDGMRPEFKEAMDSYEVFFDEYCDFMKKYSESSDVTALLSDYTDYMAKYADAMQKLDELGEEELNSAELKYYTEVMGRINQKLVEAAVQ